MATDEQPDVVILSFIFVATQRASLSNGSPETSPSNIQVFFFPMFYFLIPVNNAHTVFKIYVW
jgi:hypothetical protein